MLSKVFPKVLPARSHKKKSTAQGKSFRAETESVSESFLFKEYSL